MPLLLWVAGAIAAAFVGLVLTLLFEDQVSVILVKTLHGFWINNGHRNLSGTWYSYYSVSPEWGTSPSAAASNDGILVIRLRQIGNKVAGTSLSRNYFISASVQDSYLTGTWRNTLGGRYDWGAFQLWWPSGQIMAGKFVGRDSRNYINHGIWLWARTEKELNNIKLVTLAADFGYVSDIDALRVRLGAALTLYDADGG